MNLDILTRKDDNGRDGPVTRLPDVATDAEGETLGDKICCCGWVRVETEGLVFFIEERGGGGGSV